MIVKSALMAFFTSRFVLLPNLLFAVFVIGSSFAGDSDRELPVKQMNLIIRQLGHELLLQGGDSTSLVMPVTEVKPGTFLLRFEKEFVFSHDSLMMLSANLLPKTKFPAGYTVTVNDCMNGSIVYGFQLNNNSPDILACNGRTQPSGCYTIEFTFPGFAENVTQQNATIGDLSALKTSGTSLLIMNVIYGGILILLAVTLLVGRFGKSSRPIWMPVQNQDHPVVHNADLLEGQTMIPAREMQKEAILALPSLGKFSFDVREQRLILGSEIFSLTDNECKVLELLHKNFCELIARDSLLQ